MISDHAPSPVRRERFERVAAQVYEPLQRFCRRRTTSDVADDTVADTLLVLWRRLDEVIDTEELAWCYGVARRVLANHRRSAGRGLRLVDRIASTMPPGSEASIHTDATVSDHSDLHRAIGRLAAGDQELLKLWAWEGLEPREIAIVLDVTPNAATIRLHRAKQRLRAELEARKSSAAAGQAPGGHKESE